MDSSKFIYDDEKIVEILGEDYVDILDKYGITVTKIDPEPKYSSAGTYGIYMTVDTPSFGEITFCYNCSEVRVKLPDVMGDNITSGNYPFRFLINDIPDGKNYEAWKEMRPALRAARLELREIRDREFLGESMLTALKDENIALIRVIPTNEYGRPNKAHFEVSLPPCNGYRFGVEFMGLEINGDFAKEKFAESFKEYVKSFDPIEKAKEWCDESAFFRDFKDGLSGTTAIKERLLRAAEKMKTPKQKNKKPVERE